MGHVVSTLLSGFQFGFAWLTYNRDCFADNAAMRQNQMYQEKSYHMSWITCARDDIRDIMYTSVLKMICYMTIATLIIFFAGSAVLVGQVDDEAEHVLKHTYYVSMFTSMMSLTLSVFFGIRGCNTAFQYSIQLLTKAIAPEATASYDFDYMKQVQQFEKSKSVVRIPLWRPLWRRYALGHTPKMEGEQFWDATHKSEKIRQDFFYFEVFSELRMLWAPFEHAAQECMFYGMTALSYGGIYYSLGKFDHPNEVFVAITMTVCFLFLLLAAFYVTFYRSEAFKEGDEVTFSEDFSRVQLALGDRGFAWTETVQDMLGKDFKIDKIIDYRTIRLKHGDNVVGAPFPSHLFQKKGTWLTMSSASDNISFGRFERPMLVYFMMCLLVSAPVCCMGALFTRMSLKHQGRCSNATSQILWLLCFGSHFLLSLLHCWRENEKRLDMPEYETLEQEDMRPSSSSGMGRGDDQAISEEDPTGQRYHYDTGDTAPTTTGQTDEIKMKRFVDFQRKRIQKGFDQTKTAMRGMYFVSVIIWLCMFSESLYLETFNRGSHFSAAVLACDSGGDGIRRLSLYSNADLGWRAVARVAEALGRGRGINDVLDIEVLHHNARVATRREKDRAWPREEPMTSRALAPTATHEVLMDWPSRHFRPHALACTGGRIFAADEFRVFELEDAIPVSGGTLSGPGQTKPLACALAGAIVHIAAACDNATGCRPLVLVRDGLGDTHIVDCARGNALMLSAGRGASHVAEDHGRGGLFVMFHDGRLVEYERSPSRRGILQPLWEVEQFVPGSILAMQLHPDTKLLIFRRSWNRDGAFVQARDLDASEAWVSWALPRTLPPILAGCALVATETMLAILSTRGLEGHNLRLVRLEFA